MTENGKTRETGKTVRPDGSIYTAAELQRRGEAELAASMSRREALAKKAAAEFDWKGALVDLGVEASGLGDIKRCVMDRDVGACAWAVAGTAGAAIFKAGKTIKKVKNLIDNVRSFNDVLTERAASAALSKLDGQISKQAAELKSLAAKVKRSPSSSAGGARKASAKTEAPRRGGGGSSKSSGPREHACSLNSFAGRTLVLMGDKSKKPIEKVRVGEKVWATDPKTGEKGPRTVTHVWKHRDALVDLKVDGETITTTEDHPFWSESEGRFKDAEELRRGELLLRWDRGTSRSSRLDQSSWRGGTAYNLTVSGLHTYHVGASGSLVHNCGTVESVADFGSKAEAFKHYAKHSKGVVLDKGDAAVKRGGADMPEFASLAEYRVAARDFMGGAAGDGVLEKMRGTDLLRVDPSTGHFGVRTSDGRIRTFFRPDGDPVEYFWRQ
ncbi:polymorphic toxin-type HINT domain-containing protein [Aeromicrobium sp. CnD17-E]|uniref:polymorphic toxin-type HINT domain-containing protein n=1 Tax=Aeromicrobium sp. CnD17-E TaxID=2954487 RepID=UPI0020973444|nr:polymorphic toxin-type HINT domain-containing protein [Aeromicrobium sp. CnD17-E]MCO7237614.1 HINT domain-containing protein [Aeromicrobium sp. CnD17-E]